MSTRPQTTTPSAPISDCILHPIDCATGARDRARQQAADIVQQAAGTVAGARASVTTFAQGGLAAVDRSLTQASSIAQWIAIAAIAVAVIVGILAAVYFASPIIAALK